MSQLKTNSIANVAGTDSTDVLNVINGSAKAWVNFNGTGTVAIRAAYNVSSITDNGTGNYTVNFTNAMSDTNYLMVCGGSEGNNTSNARFTNGFASATTSASVYYSSYIGSITFNDAATVSVAIFR